MSDKVKGTTVSGRPFQYSVFFLSSPLHSAGWGKRDHFSPMERLYSPVGSVRVKITMSL